MSDEFDESPQQNHEPQSQHRADLGGVDDALSAGVPPAKFEEIGTVVRGTIVTAEMAQQRDMATGKLKFWDDGNPCKQILITLATTDRSADIDDDDGHRRVYVKVPSAMLKAIRAALGKTKLSEAIGGTLALKFTGLGEASQKGFNKPKMFAAKFTPANGATTSSSVPTQTAPSESIVENAKKAAWEAFKATFPPGSTNAELGVPWRALVAKISGGKAHPDIDSIGWGAIQRAAQGYQGEPEGAAAGAGIPDEDIPFAPNVL